MLSFVSLRLPRCNQKTKQKIESHLKLEKGSYLQLLVPETMKLLTSTKKEITKDRNVKMCCI